MPFVLATAHTAREGRSARMWGQGDRHHSAHGYRLLQGGDGGASPEAGLRGNCGVEVACGVAVATFTPSRDMDPFTHGSELARRWGRQARATLAAALGVVDSALESQRSPLRWSVSVLPNGFKRFTVNGMRWRATSAATRPSIYSSVFALCWPRYSARRVTCTVS